MAKSMLDPGALWQTLLGEYSYMNFPVKEIVDWLLPQLTGARRIALLEDCEGRAAEALFGSPRLRGLPFAGIWTPGQLTGPSWRGIPVFGSFEEVAAAAPDCLVPVFRSQSERLADLQKLARQTGARVVPNVLFSNPFSGSQTIQYTGAQGPGLADPRIPHKQQDSIARHLHRYFFASQFAAGKAVLDCACGVGYGTHILSRAAREVIGADLDPHLIGYARQYNAASNIQYVCDDLIRLRGALRVDLLTSVETFEHVPADRLPLFVEAMQSLLHPGGTLVCTTPKRAVTVPRPPNPQHVAEYSTEEFLSYLEPHFTVKGVWFQTHDRQLLQELPPGHPLPDSQIHTHVVQIAICTRR